jgi:hypothetical protein
MIDTTAAAPPHSCNDGTDSYAAHCSAMVIYGERGVS